MEGQSLANNTYPIENCFEEIIGNPVANNTYCIENCDILKGKNDIQEKGFDKNLSFEQIRDIAIYHKSPIIVRTGSGKWYLKCNMKEPSYIKSIIMKNKNKNKNKKYLEGTTLYFIDFSQFK
tara:strand:+ start:111 stop:476 length:366 start_codon:yes stop_codon:yes gene_type:complete